MSETKENITEETKTVSEEKKPATKGKKPAAKKKTTAKKVEAKVAQEKTAEVKAETIKEEAPKAEEEIVNEEAPKAEKETIKEEAPKEETEVKEEVAAEEKKPEQLALFDATPIEDDDFADTRGKQLEQQRAIEEAKAAEEAAKKAEEEAKEKEEEAQEVLPAHFEYDNDELRICEDARKKFFKTYKNHSTIKTIVSFGFVLLFVLMWFLPQWVSALADYVMAFTISGASIALIGVLIYSFIFKKRSQEWIHDYFSDFYGHQYNYVFSGLDLQNAQGLVEMKLQQGEIENSGLYKDIAKVGSRYCYSFAYHGHDSFIIDAAAQVKNGKMLTPVFVGKLLKTKTTYEGSGIYMYFKGNKRALPPNGVSEYNILEETDKYVIYGAEEEKKYLTQERKNALKQIRTDKVLVDASVVLKEGNLSFYLGYEDSLMVVPMDKDFNPNPTMHFKQDMETIFSIIDELNK